MARRELRFKRVSYPISSLPQVRFRIPEEWVEDYSDPEFGLFYSKPDHGGGPWPVGGMLFVFTGTNRTGTEWTSEAVRKHVLTCFADAKPRCLADGTWLTHLRSFKQEPTHDAVIHQWNRITASGCELTLFGWTFTGVAEFYSNPGDCYYKTVEMLVRETETAEVLAAE